MEIARYVREPGLAAPSMTPKLLVAYLGILRIYRFYDLSSGSSNRLRSTE